MPHGTFKTERFTEYTWPVSISKTPCGDAVSDEAGQILLYLKHLLMYAVSDHVSFLSLRRARPQYLSLSRAYTTSPSALARLEVAAGEPSSTSKATSVFYARKRAEVPRLVDAGGTRRCPALYLKGK